MKLDLNVNTGVGIGGGSLSINRSDPSANTSDQPTEQKEEKPVPLHVSSQVSGLQDFFEKGTRAAVEIYNARLKQLTLVEEAEDGVTGRGSELRDAEFDALQTEIQRIDAAAIYNDQAIFNANTFSITNTNTNFAASISSIEANGALQDPGVDLSGISGTTATGDTLDLYVRTASSLVNEFSSRYNKASAIVSELSQPDPTPSKKAIKAKNQIALNQRAVDQQLTNVANKAESSLINSEKSIISSIKKIA